MAFLESTCVRTVLTPSVLDCCKAFSCRKKRNLIYPAVLFSTAQKEGARQIERQIAYYNLDMIIGVGYAKII